MKLGVLLEFRFGLIVFDYGIRGIAVVHLDAMRVELVDLVGDRLADLVALPLGLVGVVGFSYLVSGTAALKSVGLTSMRTVTDYTFGVIPMFLLMGAFVSNSGMSRELFGSPEAAIGRDLRLNGQPFTVVGVMPAGFNFLDPEVRLWVPAAFTPEERQVHHANNWQNIGRLKPGATIGQVQAQVDALNRANLDRFPAFRELLVNAGYHTVASPLEDMLVKQVRGIAEDGRVGIRNVRRDIMSDLKELKDEGEVGADDEHRGEVELQKLTDSHVADLDGHLKAKEAEILEV